MDTQPFEEDIGKLVAEYVHHVQTRDTRKPAEMTDFATWLLIKLGYKLGRKDGYLEGVRAASKIINQMLPTFEADGESEDNATTVMMDRQQ